MRKLRDILDAINKGKMPTPSEMNWAFQAVMLLTDLTIADLHSIAQGQDTARQKAIAAASNARREQAYDTDPRVWVNAMTPETVTEARPST